MIREQDLLEIKQYAERQNTTALILLSLHRGISETDIQFIYSIDAEGVEKAKSDYQKYGTDCLTEERMAAKDAEWEYLRLIKEMPLFFEIIECFELLSRGNSVRSYRTYENQMQFLPIPKNIKVEAANNYKGEQIASDILEYLYDKCDNLYINPIRIPTHLFKGNEGVLFKLVFNRYWIDNKDNEPPIKDIEYHLANGFSEDALNEATRKTQHGMFTRNPIDAIKRMGGQVVLKLAKCLLLKEEALIQPNSFGHLIRKGSISDLSDFCKSLSTPYFNIKSTVITKEENYCMWAFRHIFNHSLVITFNVRDSYGKLCTSRMSAEEPLDDFEGIDTTIQKLKQYAPEEMNQFMKDYPNMEIKDAALKAIRDEIHEAKSFIDEIYVEYIEVKRKVVA